MPAINITKTKILDIFRQAIVDDSNRLYTFLGKITPWLDEENVDFPSKSNVALTDLWDNIFYLKKIDPADISLGIRKYVWTSANTYSQYDDKFDYLDKLENPFYVLSSNNCVYKCISNNMNKPSYIEPLVKTLDSVFATADGYIWKYMYEISDELLDKFATTAYIPISYVTENNGSDQYKIQNLAKSGSVENVRIIANGSDYDETPTIIVTGDGTGFSASVELENGSIKKINVNNSGINYTKMSLSLSYGNAVIEPIYSPVGGHGSNPIEELLTNILLNSVTYIDNYYGQPTGISFRQIGLILNPKKVNGDLVTEDYLDCTYKLKLKSITGSIDVGSNFTINNTITGTVLGYSEGEGDYLLSFINKSPRNTVINVDDVITFASGTALVDTVYIGTEVLNLLSGDLLHIENLPPIARIPSHTQHIVLSLTV